MKRLVLALAASLLVTTHSIAQTPAAPAPAPGAEVYIISPRNGAKLHSPVTVGFGLRGMGVAPAAAGEIDNTGHHHLLIDTDLSAVDLHAPLHSKKITITVQ
jgi:hypothetical protein